MRKLAIVIVAFSTAGSVLAAPFVDWGHQALDKVFENYGSVAFAPGDFLATGSIVQLIYSDDATIGPISTSDPFLPTGNDSLLTSSTIGTHSGAPGQAGVLYYGGYDLTTASTTNGYAYMRVFQATSTAVTPGQTLYFAEGPAPTHPKSPPDTAPTVDLLGTSASNFYALDKSVTVVPEPASALLLMLGAGVLGYRRYRRNRK